MKIPGHPLALEYPRASEAEKSVIKADMKTRGFDERFPIILFNGKILDGITRNECADELNINPYFEPFEGGLEEAAAFVIRANEHRRHLTAEWLADKRAKRIGREVEARLDGKTIAEIAETENVTPRTVQRDLGEAADNSPLSKNNATEDDACRGKNTNGKTTSKAFCDRCKLNKSMGRKAIKDCEMCKQIRSPKTAKNNVVPDFDANGEPAKVLPKSVANALADVWHADCARLLAGMAKQCAGAFGWSTWLDGSVLDHLKNAEECFITAIPKRACPDCKGQKKIDKDMCLRCRGGGYLGSQGDEK
jgi:hypothetical protein